MWGDAPQIAFDSHYPFFVLTGGWAVSEETASAAAIKRSKLTVLCVRRVRILLMDSSFMGGCDVSWSGRVGCGCTRPSHLLHFADDATKRILKDLIITNRVEAWVEHH